MQGIDINTETSPVKINDDVVTKAPAILDDTAASFIEHLKQNGVPKGWKGKNSIGYMYHRRLNEPEFAMQWQTAVDEWADQQIDKLVKYVWEKPPMITERGGTPKIDPTFATLMRTRIDSMLKIVTLVSSGTYGRKKSPMENFSGLTVNVHTGVPQQNQMVTIESIDTTVRRKR